MISAVRIPIILMFVLLAFPADGIARVGDFDGAGFYKSLEETARVAFDQAVATFNAAKEERIRAGKITAAEASNPDGLSGVKLLIYNEFAIYAICADSINRGESEKASAELERCSRDKKVEMVKWTKLVEYANTIGATKIKKCEMKSRDFKNEIFLPPFDFLKDDSGPPLFDFGKLNECLTNAP